MRLDLPKLGGAMMAVSPVLIQLSGSKAAWWVGLGFAIIGPFLLSIRHPRK